MLLKRLLNFIIQIKCRYLFTNSIVRIEKKGTYKIGCKVCISNSRIFVSQDSVLEIEDNVIIKNTNLYIKGKVFIGENSMIERGYQSINTIIRVEGNMLLANNSRLRCNIRIRFGGNLQIGCYTNINEETEIRVDDSVTIGDYNQISYKCIIWDTNTHNIYQDEERRKLAEEYFPVFGYEYEKPKTKPVFIGDDCWIGREVAILKGVKINNSSIIGFRTTLSNCEIEKNKIVVSENKNIIIERNKR